MSQSFEYFGKYILLEKLAMGGMAEVWLARAPGAGGIGKFVAIKKILPQFSDNPEFIQMFKDEAAIAMNLSHSNIVSIYEFGQEKNQLFLVMDYVEGRNLRQMLNKMKTTDHKFATDQIVYMLKEIAAGLDHAHRSLNSATGKPLNITHRDMSPQNVMLTFEGEVRIVDFGIAKAESQVETTRTGTLKGKFGYMSPEQAEGHPTDLRTDIFSVGIIIWELLANDRLFIANNEINTLKKIRECNVPSLTKINPSIHPELERIVMKALTRDRNLRYQTASLLHRDLNKFLNRQFPDFSPHDYSVFIKTLYTDEILDLRKRLVEYAKIPFRQVSSRYEEDKTIVTSFPQSSEMKTNARTVKSSSSDQADGSAEGKTQRGTEPSITATQTFSDDTNNNEASVTRPPLGTNERMGDSISISKDTKPVIKIPTGPLLDENILKKSMDRSLAIKPKMPYTLNDDSMEPKLQKSYDGNRAQPQKQRVKTRGPVPRQSNQSLNLMIFVAFTIMTYIVASTLFPKETGNFEGAIKRMIAGKNSAEVPSEAAQPKTQQIPDPKFSMDEGPVQPIAPKDFKSTYSLIVNSVPSGAEIYVNNMTTGKTTPEKIDVPAEGEFTIQLKLDHYIDYLKPRLTTAITGHTFTANLQRAMVGYLDIDVKPPVNVRVFINGEPLKNEILPIANYAIPANVSVRVRAVDLVSGVDQERTVTLRVDQHYQVLFELNKGRAPSSR